MKDGQVGCDFGGTGTGFSAEHFGIAFEVRRTVGSFFVVFGVGSYDVEVT